MALQRALDDFNELYKNSLYIERKNNLTSKKLFGHRLFKKSENALFNFIIMGSLAGGMSVLYYNMLMAGTAPLTILPAACLIAGASTIPVVLTTNALYHINKHSSGKLGRTYAKMSFDYYFKLMNENIKKKYMALVNCKNPTEKTKQKMIKFCKLLEGYSSNFNYNYNKLKQRVKKYSAKKQQKWAPVLEAGENYSKYLNANAQKFMKYAEILESGYEQVNLPEFEKIKEKVEGNTRTIICEQDLKHTSDFELFKKYILKKKELNKQRLDKFDNEMKL